jgi:hypothetical protein
MKQQRQTPRTAIALLLAGIALPLTPAFAQDAVAADPPVVNAPPPVMAPAPPPPVVRIAPPPVAAQTPRVTTPPPVAAPAPPRISEPAADPAPTATRSRARPATRRAQAASRPAPAPAPAEPVAEAVPAPVAAPVAPPIAPTAAPPPAALPVTDQVVPPEEAGSGLDSALPWLVGAALLAIAAFAAFALSRRRRRTDEVYYEEAYEPELAVEPSPGLSTSAALAAAVPLAAAAPMAAQAPIAAYDDVDRIEHPAEPVASSADRMAIGEPDAADVEALAAASDAPAGRPWLEFLLRPLRAGTTSDDTVVEFELTVSNTGSVPARDVRISTWMFAAGSPAESEMERMLIEPPAEAQSPRIEIAAGDGTRVEGALALAKSGLDESVLPVVVADARYTLPDGSEGRTSASFEVGMPGEEALAPFPTDRASGLIESVEARLHGDLERV